MLFEARELHASMENVSIFADKHKISQALRNFLSNALKFTPIGGKITLRISIIRRRSDTLTDSVSTSEDIFDKLSNWISDKANSLNVPESDVEIHETDVSRCSVESIANSSNYRISDMICRVKVFDTGAGIAQV